MLVELKASQALLAVGATLVCIAHAPLTIGAEPPAPHPAQAVSVEAQFRGCEAAGWCKFWIESPHLSPESMYRVRPDGIVPTRGDASHSIAVRDRLNALLSSMIHQHKRIVLHDLRALDDGTFAATVTVNGANVASDPMLVRP